MERDLVLSGSKRVFDELSSTSDVERSVRSIQKEYEDVFLSCFSTKKRRTEVRSLLQMADFLSLPRANLYASAAENLRTQIVAATSKADEATLNSLLQQMLPFVGVEDLQSVILTALHAHRRVPIVFIMRIKERHPLFFEKLSSTLRQRAERGCTKEDYKILISKHQIEEISTTLREIGESCVMFEDAVRDLYVESADDGLCALRNDVLARLSGGGEETLLTEVHRFLRKRERSSAGTLPTDFADQTFSVKISARLEHVLAPLRKWSRECVKRQQSVADALAAIPGPSKERLRECLDRARQEDIARSKAAMLEGPVFETSPLVFANYTTRVEKPMWFAKVAEKIEDGAYATERAFADDIDLIVRNCWTFNGKTTVWGSYATAFQKSIAPVLNALVEEGARRRSKREAEIHESMPPLENLSAEAVRNFADAGLILADPRLHDATVYHAIAQLKGDFRGGASVLGDAEHQIVAMGCSALVAAESVARANQTHSRGSTTALDRILQLCCTSSSAMSSVSQMIADDARRARNRKSAGVTMQFGSAGQYKIDVSKSDGVVRSVLLVYAALCVRDGQVRRLEDLLRTLFRQDTSEIVFLPDGTNVASAPTKLFRSDKATRCFLVRSERFVAMMVDECLKRLAGREADPATNKRIVETLAEFMTRSLMLATEPAVRLVLHKNLTRLLLGISASSTCDFANALAKWTKTGLYVWDLNPAEQGRESFRTCKERYARLREARA
eukprot:g423.t1